MPSDIAQMVISLAMESGNFEAGIKSAKKEVAGIQTDFKAAAVSAGHFGKGLDGTRANFESLTKQAKAQNQVIELYKSKLEATKGSLEKAQATQTKYADAVEKSKEKVARLSTELDEATKAYKASAKAEGENAEETIRLGLAMEEMKDQFKEAKTEAKAAASAYELQKTTVKNAAKAVQDADYEYKKASLTQAQIQKKLKDTTNQLKYNAVAWTEWGEKTSKAGKAMAETGKKLTMGITTPVAALGGVALKSSIDFESAFAGVRKTVDATEAEYAKLSAQIREMATEIPSSADAIAEVMEAAGQLGIQKDSLLDFTRVMIDLGNATNLTSTEGAASLAKFANITQMSQKDFDKLGSVIVDLGNKTATTEKDIVDMSMRLAGAGTQIGLTQNEILGFAAALSSVGVEADAGGSAFSKVFTKMQLAVETGKNGLSDFARVAGMSSKDFQKAFKEDAAGAVQSFIVGMSRMDEQGISAIKTLDDMGLTEVRLRDTLLRATNASELFASTMDTAKGAWKANTALAKEASTRYGTTASRLEILKNKGQEAARVFGDDMKPAFNGLLDSASGLLETFMGLDQGTRQTVIQLAGVAAAAGPVVTVFGKAKEGVGNFAKQIGTMKKAVAEAGGGMKGLASTITPMGWVALAAAVGFAAYKLYDYASGAAAARKANEGLTKTAQEWQATMGKSIFSSGQDPFERLSASHSLFGGVVETTKKDAKELSRLDGQYEKLIAKQSKTGELSEKDQKKLDQVIQRRVEIRMEYATDGEDGYEEVLTGMEAEIARLTAVGIKVDSDLYGDTMKALAQGKQSELSQIDSWYNQQFADIQKINDETAKQNALDALNAQYKEKQAEAAERYAEAVGRVTGKAMESEEVQKGKTGLQELMDLQLKYNKETDGKKKAGILGEMQTLTENLNKEDLVSYLATLTQLQTARDEFLASGGTKEEADALGLGDMSTDLEKFKSFYEFLDGLDVSFDGGNLEGVKGIAESLKTEMDKIAEEDLLITTAVSVTSYTPAADAVIDPIKVAVNEYENDPKAKPPSITAAITAYENLTTDEAKKEVQPELNALLKAYEETDGSEKSKAAILSAWTAYISKLETLPETVYPEIIIPAKLEFNENKATSSVSQLNQRKGFLGLTPTGAENISKVTEALENYNQATTTIRKNGDGLAIKMPNKVQGMSEAELKEAVTVLEQYYAALQNPEIEMPEGLEEQAASVISLINALTSASELASGNEKNVIQDLLAPFSESLGIKPEDLQSTIADMEKSGGDVGQAAVDGIAEKLKGADYSDAANTTAQSTYDALTDTDAFDVNSPAKKTEPVGDAASEGIGKGMEDYNFTTNASKTAGNAKSKLSTATTTTAYKSSLKTIGINIAKGIGEGFAGFDMSAYAETFAKNFEDAIKQAFGIKSPATRLYPVGRMDAAGVGVGLRQYDFTRDAETVFTSLKRSLVDAVANAENGNGLNDFLSKALAVEPQIRIPNYIDILDGGMLNRSAQAGGGTWETGGNGASTIIEHVTVEVEVYNTQMNREMDARTMGRLIGEETSRTLAGLGG